MQMVFFQLAGKPILIAQIVTITFAEKGSIFVLNYGAVSDGVVIER